jgi:PAS domain S-box-containing protein
LKIRSYIDDLVEFESRVNDVWRSHDDAVICTYQLGKFGGDTVIDIMRTHPMIIIGGLLHRNPFYLPPRSSCARSANVGSCGLPRPPGLPDMEVQPEHASGEVKHLQRCINDLVSLLALPAIWSGGDPSQVLHILLDALVRMLRLDLVSVRLTDPVGGAPVEIVHFAELQRQSPMPSAHEICEALGQCLQDDSRKWPPLLRNLMGEGDVSIVPLPLGSQGELGVIVAAAERTDFPRQTEALLLSVAANQASIGLQEARLLSHQKRLASELDQRVVQRTAELAAANEELKKELAERRLVEERLGQEERELKRSEVAQGSHLDSALDCIVTIDHEGCITEFNPAAERTFGYRRDEVLGKHLADVIIPPSLREKHRQGFARYLATGEARVLGKRIEMTAVRADGSEFPVELAITRIPLEGPPSFTGYLRDITERKRAEQELRRSEAFLAEAQHLSRIGSFSWRVATDEITWSEQLYRIFQIDRDVQVTFELIGTRIHPEDLSVFREHIERSGGTAAMCNSSSACRCRTARSSTYTSPLTPAATTANWSTSAQFRT